MFIMVRSIAGRWLLTLLSNYVNSMALIHLFTCDEYLCFYYPKELLFTKILI